VLQPWFAKCRGSVRAFQCLVYRHSNARDLRGAAGVWVDSTGGSPQPRFGGCLRTTVGRQASAPQAPKARFAERELPVRADEFLAFPANDFHPQIQRI